MFTKKDKKIKQQQEIILKNESEIIRLYDKIFEQKEKLEQIYAIASSNTYGSDGTAYLSKIKELSKQKY